MLILPVTSPAAKLDTVHSVHAVEAGVPTSPQWHRQAVRVLRRTGAAWLFVALVGQLLLAIYVVGFYGRAAAEGRLQDWSRVLPKGYVSGEPFLNAVLASHLAFVVVIILGGILQLVPSIRRRWPAFHRWIGRLYLFSAVVLSAGGLVLVWVRGTVGDWAQHLAISLNAVLIIGFAAMTWQRAHAQQSGSHRRWALRLFLAVSGVWFFRVGLMLWIVVNQGPVGFDPKTFVGPFLTVLSFAQFLLPLAVLQLYFHAQDCGSPRAQLLMAGGLSVLTLATLAGIAAASAFMWWPRLGL